MVIIVVFAVFNWTELYQNSLYPRNFKRFQHPPLVLARRDPPDLPLPGVGSGSGELLLLLGRSELHSCIPLGRRLVPLECLGLCTPIAQHVRRRLRPDWLGWDYPFCLGDGCRPVGRLSGVQSPGPGFPQGLFCWNFVRICGDAFCFVSIRRLADPIRLQHHDHRLSTQRLFLDIIRNGPGSVLQNQGLPASRATGLNILFLSQLVPYPPDAGPKVRSYYTLRYLAQMHDVTLLAFSRPDDTPEALEHLRSFCRAVHAVPLVRSRGRDLQAMLASLLTGKPFVIRRDSDSQDGGKGRFRVSKLEFRFYPFRSALDGAVP